MFRTGPKTVDFLGEFGNGHAIALEAKETREEHRFPFRLVDQHDHQVDWMHEWKGIGLLLIHSVGRRRTYGVAFEVFLEARADPTKRSWTWDELERIATIVDGYNWLPIARQLAEDRK